MIGKLDQRITLRDYTPTADGAGGFTKAWADTATVWARVEAKSGRESLDAGRVNASGSYVFTIRNRDGVNEQTQIVWGGEAFNVRDVLREGSRAPYLKIEAERGAAQ